MADNGGQEKTEQATGKRRSEARDKGQVAKSADLSALLMLFSGAFLIFVFQSTIGSKIKEVTILIFSSLHTLDVSNDNFMDYAYEALLFFILLLAPVALGLIVVSIASGFGQVGFKFSSKALAPNFARLNPANGIKKVLVGKSSLVELGKSLAKLVIIASFAYWVLEDIIEDSKGLIFFSIEQVLEFMVGSTFSFIWKICLAFAFFALGDFIYQRYKHNKDLMMTKQEVKEEHKQEEGDPQIKGKIRSKQFQMARRRMIQNVPESDVVITNPTHYAIALKYEIGQKGAPLVLAKGVNEVAQRIKKVATEHNIPLYEDRELARALYKSCEVGEEIPASLFKAVAQILAYIFKLKNTKKKKSIV